MCSQGYRLLISTIICSFKCWFDQIITVIQALLPRSVTMRSPQRKDAVVLKTSGILIRKKRRSGTICLSKRYPSRRRERQCSRVVPQDRGKDGRDGCRHVQATPLFEWGSSHIGPNCYEVPPSQHFTAMFSPKRMVKAETVTSWDSTPWHEFEKEYR